MKTRSLRRNRGRISFSRWTAYAAAGAATAFISPPEVDGAIHYSGLVDENFAGGQIEIFPLDPNGPAELVFRHNLHYYSTSVVDGGSAFVSLFYGSPAGISNSCASNNSIGSALPLRRRAVISQQPFSSRAIIIGTRSGDDCGGGDRGLFEAGLSFIGFKFNNGKGDQYGWARIKVLTGNGHDFRLVDYAYGDVGDKVKAGGLSAGRFVDSLGALALGRAGMDGKRGQSGNLGKLSSRASSGDRHH